MYNDLHVGSVVTWFKPIPIRKANEAMASLKSK